MTITGVEGDVDFGVVGKMILGLEIAGGLFKTVVANVTPFFFDSSIFLAWILVVGWLGEKEMGDAGIGAIRGFGLNVPGLLFSIAVAENNYN